MNNSIERMAAQSVPTPDDLDRLAPPPRQAAGLARILTEPRPTTVRTRPPLIRRTWTPLLVGTVVLVLLGVTALIGLRPPAAAPAPIATPALLTFDAGSVDPDPAALLRRLAQQAAVQPPNPDRGRYDYVRTRGWYFDMEGHADGTMTGRVNLTEREDWQAQDGSGRIEESRSGVRSSSSAEYPPGELYVPQRLPENPAELEQAVVGERGPDLKTWDWFMELASLWHFQVVSPGAQAAFLEVLATKPDIVVSGAVTDRVGRQGVAVSTTTYYADQPDALPLRYTLIFDPETGALLGEEQVALEKGDMPVEAPATVSYTVWLESGRVDSTSERPS
jgi:hypothetical protein